MPWRDRVFRRLPSDHGAVTLAHSRIYILPSRRGLAFLGTLAMMLVTSLNYSLALGFVATFLLTGLLAAALLHTFRNLAGITIRPVGAAEAFAGQPLPFMLALAAGARERIAISLGARGAKPQWLDIAAQAQANLTLEVDSVRRGRLALGRIGVASDFPLGLWRAWAYVHFPLDGVVYPAPEPGAPPPPMQSQGEGETSGTRGDESDLAGLRSFVHGDPMQRVAWKTVAAGRGWHTKTFDAAGGAGPAVLDYAALPAALPVEMRISRLTAWVLACEHAGRPCALKLPRQHIPAGSGREHSRALLTALALFEG